LCKRCDHVKTCKLIEGNGIDYVDGAQDSDYELDELRNKPSSEGEICEYGCLSQVKVDQMIKWPSP
jgi:hypothetical protein